MTQNAYPYMFNSLSRIGNDNTSIDQRNIQNMNNTNYLLENYYPACPMNQAMDFALKQPNVFYNGSHEGGIKGCEIEQNNNLKFTHITRPACKLTLTPRPFLTVPYLGKGLSNPDAEFMLKTGENNSLNKKTVNPMMEQNISEKHNYPLINEVKEYVNNSAYTIEDDAMPGWQRGGISAREHARNLDKKVKY
jgi:hypothetical protein